jgi:hypothetical protein
VAIQNQISMRLIIINHYCRHFITIPISLHPDTASVVVHPPMQCDIAGSVRCRVRNGVQLTRDAMAVAGRFRFGLLPASGSSDARHRHTRPSSPPVNTARACYSVSRGVECTGNAPTDRSIHFEAPHNLVVPALENMLDSPRIFVADTQNTHGTPVDCHSISAKCQSRAGTRQLTSMSPQRRRVLPTSARSAPLPRSRCARWGSWPPSGRRTRETRDSSGSLSHRPEREHRLDSIDYL